MKPKIKLEFEMSIHCSDEELKERTAMVRDTVLNHFGGTINRCTKAQAVTKKVIKVGRC